MLSLVAEQAFQSEVLARMQQRAGGATGAVRAYHKLKAISQAYNISFNPLVHQILCGLLLWDYQLAAVVSRWKKTYGTQVAGCSDMIAELEDLMSFSVLGMVRETGEGQIDYTETEVHLEGTNLYHPLLLPDQAQGNDVTLGSGITIITGSNMSGKTTFFKNGCHQSGTCLSWCTSLCRNIEGILYAHLYIYAGKGRCGAWYLHFLCGDSTHQGDGCLPQRGKTNALSDR